MDQEIALATAVDEALKALLALCAEWPEEAQLLMTDSDTDVPLDPHVKERILGAIEKLHLADQQKKQHMASGERARRSKTTEQYDHASRSWATEADANPVQDPALVDSQSTFHESPQRIHESTGYD